MMRPAWPLALALLLAPCAAQSQESVESLLLRGELDRAQALAESMGDTGRRDLADVLLYRGGLARAESLYTVLLSERGPDARHAAASLAELAARRGDRATVRQLAAGLAAEWRSRAGDWSARDHLAAGRALQLLGVDNPQSVRESLRAFDAATAADPQGVAGMIAAADIFMERYNAPDAEAEYRKALVISPDDPRALTGLARVASFAQGNAGEPLEAALKVNPRWVPALLLKAQLQLDVEQYDSARVAVNAALAVDSSQMRGWALLGALAWLDGDSAAYHSAEQRATALNPRPAEFHATIAEAAGRHRLYAEAVEIARKGVELDSTSVATLGALGTNLLRVGKIAEGKAVLERAFARDPFHIWHKNTLDLVDELEKFVTVRTERFEIVAPATHAERLAVQLGPMLEAAHDSLATRYQYSPPTPIRIELYDRHADFSVRTVGLAGLGALGVSFGTVLVMDAPSARQRGEFNVGSTAWHELAHTFTLGASAHRVPRWVSEGLSVLEERRARPGWGARASVSFIQALAGGNLLPIGQLNDGFVRPDGPGRIGLSYYQASLVMEYLEQQYGIAGIRKLLGRYAAGDHSDAALHAVTGIGTDSLDREFQLWLRVRFETPLASLGNGDADVFGTPLNRAAAALESGDTSRAITLLRSARERFPEYGGAAGPALPLARLLWQRGERAAALGEIAAVTSYDETAVDANLTEAQWRIAVGDSARALTSLQRATWISPDDVEPWRQRATLAAALGQHRDAIVARRYLVARGPSDPVAARTDLAEALILGGEPAAARRELLTVLETAPSYERAQELLLRARQQ